MRDIDYKLLIDNQTLMMWHQRTRSNWFTNLLFMSLFGRRLQLQVAYASAILSFCLLPSMSLADDKGADAKTEGEMKAYTQKIANTEVTFDLVPIPGGEFLMGSPATEKGRKDDEGPQHKVKVEPFWMGKHEVTWDEFELWSLLMDSKLRKFQGLAATPLDKKADAVTKPTPPYTDMSFGMGKDGGYPAICMTQHAAKKYCEWLSAKTGRYHRLPTEAEWEYACRAGTKTAYSFGDDASKIDDYAWHAGNSEVDGQKKYHQVGKKKPNPWGLFDMHGNAAEWVQDKYDPEFYKKFSADKAATFPICLAESEYPRVARGGSWKFEATEARSATRLGSEPEWKEQDPQLPKSAWYMTDALFVGFRVIRPLRVPSEEERKNLRLDAVLPSDSKERITIEE
jgi:formylglycine-generating enzyme required for sulfatase activity